jgi:hypothetical protein
MNVGELKKQLSLMRNDKEVILPDGSPIGDIVDCLNIVELKSKDHPQTTGVEYRVNIHERLTRSVVVVAESEEDALEEVKNSYEAGEIAITSDDYMETKFDVEEN